MTGDLKELANCRDALLLAELAAWLHDFKKCSDEQVRSQAVDKPNDAQGLSINCIDNYIINPLVINLFNESITFNDLVKRSGKRRNNQDPDWIVRAMRRCHHAAHIEKEEADDKDAGKQHVNDTRLSNPFGFEGDPLVDLTNRLIILLANNLNDRKSFLNAVRSAFVHAPGETRRPTNEVTLWDWSFVVAALYKTAIARAVLTNDEVDPDQMRWKLFSVRFAGLECLQNSHRISDLLVRREVLQDALNKVKSLIEEEYPLAMEAYRDENGSVYVVPDLGNILAYQDENKHPLRELILKSFGEGTVKNNSLLSLGGEMLPSLNEDDETWRAQLPKSPDEEEYRFEFPPIAKHISKVVLLQSKASEVSEWWSSHSEERCVVCGLRPQGYGAPDINEHYRRKKARKSCHGTCQTCKAIERKVCWICEERRADRSMEWAKSLKNTIWMDEVADANGRIALIVGYFDSSQWIEGTMIETLAVDVGNGTAKTKNPSFARIRRVWETTRQFWQGILPTEEETEIIESEGGITIGLAGPRLIIKGKPHPLKNNDTLGPYHSYELLLHGTKLSAVWIPEGGGNGGYFVTAKNSALIARLLDKPLPDPDKTESSPEYQKRLHEWAAETIEKEILGRGTLTIEEPTGYGSQNKIWGTIEIGTDTVKPIPDSTYTPAIPILAEPRTFMALVPADKALDVVSKINEKYEREMGKVRNRLPLHLGVVFAPYKTPLRAIMDAGRRMLKQTAPVDGWKVEDDPQTNKTILTDTLRNDPHFKEYVRLKLSHGGRNAVWNVPLMMGDGSTRDEWYPYVFIQRDKDGNIPNDRNRMFEAPCPGNPDSEGNPLPTWLVHAGDLQKGDVIYFTPATVDFQWLDTSGRRFEIAYGDKGSRLGIPRRPYLPNEFENLHKIWDTLSDHLTSTQIHALREMIEAKREEWEISGEDTKPMSGPDGDPGVFWKFCRDAIVNLEWKKNRNGKYPWALDKNRSKTEWLKKWADYAVRGWLDDAIELHMQIMKEKPKCEKERSL